MTIKEYTFEGGVDQASITAADTGSGNSFTSTSGGTRKYEATDRISGVLSGHIIASAVTSEVRWDDVFSLGPLAFRAVYRFRGDTSANGASIVSMRTSAGAVCAVNFNTGGSIRANDGNGLVASSALAVPVDGSGIRVVRGYCEPGASTTTGRYKFEVHDFNDFTTALVAVDKTTANIGTSPLSRIRFGLNSGTGSCDYIIDSMYVTDELTDLPPFPGNTFLRSFNEGIDLSDLGYLVSVEHQEIITESLGILDSLLKQSVYNIIFTESLNSTDPVGNNAIKQVIDALDILDTITNSVTINRVLSEIINLTDNLPAFQNVNAIARGNQNIFDELVAMGYTTGTIMDRERARLLSKTGAGSQYSLMDLYFIAGERPRLI